MGKIYFSIALLALYGDVVKRFVPSFAALGMLYAAAIAILGMIVWHRRGKAGKLVGSDAQLVRIFVSLLIVTYTGQFFTSFNAPLLDGFSHLLYMVIPLSYILVVQKYAPQFSLDKLARPFLWMMIPINIIGIIQFSINPDFLVSTVYSGDFGGVINRNLLEGGFFKRFPSIFASADRYSAMALMQFYFSWALLTAKERISRRGYLWFTLNLVSSIIALGVAGARSRVLIVIVVLLLVLIAKFLHGVIFRKVAGRNMAMALISMVAITLVITFGSSALNNFSASAEYPILLFLQQSFTQGDIQDRVGEAVLFSLLPDDASWFGQGLGTIGVGGKPGEFGIQSTWTESGFIFGGLILMGLFALFAVLVRRALQAALQGQGIQLIMCVMPMLLLLFAILAGLTSSFELSTGILLGCAIAVVVRRQDADCVMRSGRPAGRLNSR